MLEQLDIFNFIDEKQNTYKIKNKIRLIELFAGIGSQAKALKRIGADFEHYKVVEFDKYAIASYNAIHNTNFTTQDITRIKGNELEITDTDKYTYIMTYSFPCQDLSLAGKQKGMSKGSSTRSGLLWEVERLLNETKKLPQILLMENVPQVHSKKNIVDFDKWIEFLQSKGYSNFWQDLNAKDYGIPQSRNRTFMVSILGSYDYIFPKPFELKLRLKDMLENEVEAKWYLSDKMSEKYERNMKEKLCDELIEKGIVKVNYVINHSYTNGLNGKNPKSRITLNDYVETTDNTMPCLTTRGDTLGVVVLGNYSPSNHNAREIPKILVNGNKSIIETLGKNEVDDGVFIDGYNRLVRKDGLSGTITTRVSASNNTYICIKEATTAIKSGLRIRKLTPKECWRLMGFDDEDFEKASKFNSNAQLYKQAGNSIVVNVLEAIFKELL